MKEDLLEWVDKYMEEYKINELAYIKKGIEESSNEQDILAEEIFQINRLITATKQGLDSNKNIETSLLKKI